MVLKSQSKDSREMEGKSLPIFPSFFSFKLEPKKGDTKILTSPKEEEIKEKDKNKEPYFLDVQNSKFDVLLQLKLRSRKDSPITRLPNGKYLAECTKCDAGTVLESYDDALLALLDHKCHV
jgi:hypothetical protein